MRGERKRKRKKEKIIFWGFPSLACHTFQRHVMYITNVCDAEGENHYEISSVCL